MYVCASSYVKISCYMVDFGLLFCHELHDEEMSCLNVLGSFLTFMSEIPVYSYEHITREEWLPLLQWASLNDCVNSWNTDCKCDDSLTVCTWWAGPWTPASECGRWRPAHVVTRSWVTSRSPRAWSSATTSWSLATPTPPSRCGTSSPASVCRRYQVQLQTYTFISNSTIYALLLIFVQDIVHFNC